jgi:hypothetical protein
MTSSGGALPEFAARPFCWEGSRCGIGQHPGVPAQPPESTPSASTDADPLRRDRIGARVSAVASLASGVASTAGLTWLVNYSLGRVSPGTEIRPMSLALVMVGLPVGALIAGLVAAVIAVVLGSRCRDWLAVAVAVLGAVLAFAPYPVAKTVFNHLVRTRGLVLAP